MKDQGARSAAEPRTVREVRERQGSLTLVAASENPMPGDAALPSHTREERLAHVRGEDLLVDLAARAEMLRPDSHFYTDARLIAWIDRELNSRERSREGWSADRIRASAARMQAKVEAMRLRILPLEGAPPLEPAATAGTIPSGAHRCKRRRCGAPPRPRSCRGYWSRPLG